MTEQKPMCGPWEVIGISEFEYDVVANTGESVANTNFDYSYFDKPDAELIAEAGTVYHETKMTPRQLLEQRDMLVEKMRSIMINDKTPDYEYGKKYTNRIGQSAPGGSRWKTPRELANEAIAKAEGGE